MDSIKFKEIFNKKLKNIGFVKKGNTWYNSTNECIGLLNLQHSSYSSLYYVNLASFIRKHNYEEKFPKEYSCHIRMRVPEIGDGGENYSEILDLETNVSDERRANLLINMIHNYCLPTLTKLSSIDGIKKLYEERPHMNFKNPYSSLGI